MQETDHNFLNSISLGYTQATKIPKHGTYVGKTFLKITSI
jgi:hypothetical protein